MKRISTILIIAAITAVFTPAYGAEWDWGQIFGNIGAAMGQTQNGNSGKTGSTLGNLLEGVFSHTDISIEEMAGNWVVDGSAVAFKSENFLSQAGGVAAAAALETELDPYFRQYGLTGAVLTIDKTGNCTIKLSRGTLKGIITRQGKGEFTFSVTLLGQKLSSIPLYIRKTSQSMDMMFDAAKLKQILSLIARFSGNNLTKTIISLLEKYDGIYVGFGMHSQSATNGNDSQGSGNSNQNGNGGSGLHILRDILTGGQNGQQNNKK